MSTRHRLAQRRKAVGHTQESLAELLGVDRSTTARWEQGKTEPSPVQRRRLATALEVTLDDLAALLSTNTVVGPPPRTSMTQDEDVNRRQFLGAVSALGMIGGATLPTGLDPDAAPGRRIGAAEVATLRQSAQLLAGQTQLIGGGSLRTSAVSAYRHVRRLLDEADYNEPTGRDLLVVAADFAVCAGWTFYDVGGQRMARHLFIDGLMLAGQADDDALTLRALNALTLQSAHLTTDPTAGRVRPGQARETVRFADRMATIAQFFPSARLQALVAGHQTVARALVGDTDGFTRAVHRARHAADRIDAAADDPEWLRFVDPIAVTTFIARGYRYRRQQATAVDIFSGLADDTAASPWNRANYRAQLAATLAEAGDTDAALTVGRSALHVLHDAAINSPRTIALLEPVRRITQDALDHEITGSP